MTRKHKSIIITGLAVISLSLIAVLFILSLKGHLPLTYTKAGDLRAFDAFLTSPRDDMRAVQINGHLIEIGRRRALQILPGYPAVLYQVRPYRKLNVKALNMTRAELYDLCINITGPGLEEFKQKAAAQDIAPLWQGRLEGAGVRIYKATQFMYVVTGITRQPVLIPQVELARFLGMPSGDILAGIIPVQEQWAGGLAAFSGKPFPYTYLINIPDALMQWLQKSAPVAS